MLCSDEHWLYANVDADLGCHLEPCIDLRSASDQFGDTTSVAPTGDQYRNLHERVNPVCPRVTRVLTRHSKSAPTGHVAAPKLMSNMG